ncbi:MAG: hypothetical protein MZV64_58790 [Ignavibacteriales bacterium]|nr:hypothetical protein [Ignavibacteriales bacterium]
MPFPDTIASNAILTYKPYSIWRKYAARGSSSKSMLISPTRGSGCMTIISCLAAFMMSGSITYAPLTFS